MRFEVFWRVAVVQLVAVALLSVLLGVIFSSDFFQSWGWLIGPLAWLGCAWLTARVVGLEPEPTLVRAVLAGIVSLLAVLIGQHWLGALVAWASSPTSARSTSASVAWGSMNAESRRWAL